MKFRFLLFFIFFSQMAFSQLNDSSQTSKGRITIYKDARVDTFVNRIINDYPQTPKIKGYRIQIYSGSNRQMANQVKSAFMVSFPEERAYIMYVQPNFKIRVGNFRSRAESLKLYHLLTLDGRFKTIFLVPDEIELPDL